MCMCDGVKNCIVTCEKCIYQCEKGYVWIMALIRPNIYYSCVKKLLSFPELYKKFITKFAQF